MLRPGKGKGKGKGGGPGSPATPGGPASAGGAQGAGNGSFQGRCWKCNEAGHHSSECPPQREGAEHAER
eukprot:11583052-Alexandrium_andersonii.AAC.1